MTNNVFVADFETRNNEQNLTNGTSVWLADICDIDNYQHHTFSNIDDFMNYLSTLGTATVYFHNLKFDGNFILYWLLTNNFTWTKEYEPKEKEFSSLITELGVFYNIKVCFSHKRHRKKSTIEFRDSAKKIVGTVREIAIAYKLPILKGDIDYNLYRDENYQATPKEIDYIHNDTEIIARVLNIFYKDGNTHLTSSGDSFSAFKECITDKIFNVLFPPPNPEQDTYIRKAYRGGVVLVNPKYQDKLLHDIKVYDVNSMYPAQMYYKPLPYGEPKAFKGKYKKDNEYNLYIQHINVCMKIKDGLMPTILMKQQLFGKKDYLMDTEGGLIELWLTNIELDLMFSHYEVYDIEYIDGLKYRSSTNIFKKYIGPLYEIKCNSSGSIKLLAKMKLNSLYGKFAMNPKHANKKPYLENGIIKYETTDTVITDSIYPAMSVFITAHAKTLLFSGIDANNDNFVYCDTDSIHLTKEAKGIVIDPHALGDWDLEKVYHTAKYLAQKTYFGIKATKDGDSNDIKVAGCPKSAKQQMTLESFRWGESFGGKLVPKKTKGGVVLVDVGFTLKER